VPNALSAPLITSWGLSCSKLAYHHPIGWRLYTQPLIFNRHPTKTLNFQTPYFASYGAHPTYHHLRVFGCKYYPNLSFTTPHKLAPHSTPCVFLGYPSDHKGYRCLDLATNRIILSRHINFDESSFPFAELPAPLLSSNLDFLSEFDYENSSVSSPFVACSGFSGSSVLVPGRTGTCEDLQTSTLPSPSNEPPTGTMSSPEGGVQFGPRGAPSGSGASPGPYLAVVASPPAIP
jgi:histone deacetylase 1/2